MNDGRRILEWAQQNKHTLTWIAERIGYSRQMLSQALHTNRISRRLADALFEEFSLRVQPGSSSNIGRNASGKAGRGDHITTVGGTSGVSKLDQYRDEIKRHLARGDSQRFIAKRFGVSDSTLSQWMKKHGLSRRRSKV